MRNELIATELAIAELDRQIKAIQDSIKLAQDTERIRKEEAAKRTADLKNLTVEVATMQKLHDDWAQTAKAANDKVESIKQSIGSLAEELTRLQRQAAQATGQRAASR
jgi:predicted  nucleic acid-binding Zn-ribbon protein